MRVVRVTSSSRPRQAIVGSGLYGWSRSAAFFLHALGESWSLSRSCWQMVITAEGEPSASRGTSRCRRNPVRRSQLRQRGGVEQQHIAHVAARQGRRVLRSANELPYRTSRLFIDVRWQHDYRFTMFGALAPPRQDRHTGAGHVARLDLFEPNVQKRHEHVGPLATECCVPN
jgi:hypothetical protein